MTFGRSGVAVLAGVAFLAAASPAFAVVAACTAKDSDGRWYTVKQTGVFDWQAKGMAEKLARLNCQSRSKQPASCKIASCTVMP